MGFVTVRARAEGVSSREAYHKVADFERYPEYSDAVREVTIIAQDAVSVTSQWSVNFRRGVLSWTERAVFQRDEGLIPFHEVEGDVDKFSGHWRISGEGDGSLIEFFVDFDIGIPTLDHILSPIAEEALIENIQSILAGLIGPSVRLESAESSSTA